MKMNGLAWLVVEGLRVRCERTKQPEGRRGASAGNYCPAIFCALAMIGYFCLLLLSPRFFFRHLSAHYCRWRWSLPKNTPRIPPPPPFVRSRSYFDTALIIFILIMHIKYICITCAPPFFLSDCQEQQVPVNWLCVAR